MEKIPTAEEFLELQHETVPSIEFDIRQAMIEFAKLHVEKALKEASENAKIIDVGIDYSIIKWVADKDSILNSYPLENIK